VYTTADQRELLAWLDTPELRGAVVLAEQPDIGYLATVYTPLRAWHSHLFNTPHRRDRRQEARAFFQDGVFLEDWRRMRILIVYDEERPVRPERAVPPSLATSARLHNDSFTVVEVSPEGPSAPAR
jgi:hypothetical protein